MQRTAARVTRVILVDGQEPQYLQLEEQRDGGEPRRLTMVIGRSAAEEISKCLKRQEDARPMTHELAFGLLKRLQGTIREMVIHELDHGTYFAELRVEHDGEVFGVDCRPSDGIALSLRGSAPIFVTEKVWDQAGEA